MNSDLPVRKTPITASLYEVIASLKFPLNPNKCQCISKYETSMCLPNPSKFYDFQSFSPLQYGNSVGYRAQLTTVPIQL